MTEVISSLIKFDEFFLPSSGALVGVDEAGRGAWAGPVVAAAVCFDPGVSVSGVDDSKKLTPAKREKLFELIVQNCKSYGVGLVPADVIDQVNILQATYQAMNQALLQITAPIGFVLVDGRDRVPGDWQQKPIVDGDAQSYCIAAASIIAKVTRDRLMTQLSGKLPGYGFERHKGYGTAQHQQALAKLGVSDEHRKSYEPIRQLLKQI